MQAGMLIYGALVFGLLIAEMRGARMWQCLLKPLAALGFCLFAVYAGALGSLYGKLILAGLVACAAGDVCLLSRDKPALFKGGMAAFALGHFLYLTAFVTFADKTAINVWAILPIVIGLGFFWWVKPKLPKDMIIPVGMYSFIIILMVMRSLDVPMIIVPVAAIMFAVSDMFVARDRFVSPGPLNALVITPLYFGAQALFALSVYSL